MRSLARHRPPDIDSGSPRPGPAARVGGALAVQPTLGNRVVGSLLAARAPVRDEHEGPGAPLPAALGRAMSGSFGEDFSGVRVHVGLRASALGAQAFARGGSDIHFAPGQYDPHTSSGQKLVAHELWHLKQQRDGRVPAPGSGSAVVSRPDLEAEADRKAEEAVARPLRPDAHAHAAPARATAAPDGRAVQLKKRIATNATVMARLGLARQANEYVRQCLPFGAGNIREDVLKTNGESATRAAVARSRVEQYDKQHPEHWVVGPQRTAFDIAAMAEHAKFAIAEAGGYCNEFADIAFVWLRHHAKGQTINLCASHNISHGFVVIGAVGTDPEADLVVADAWPTKYQECRWIDHFAHNAEKTRQGAPGGLRVTTTMIADGEDVLRDILDRRPAVDADEKKQFAPEALAEFEEQRGFREMWTVKEKQRLVYSQLRRLRKLGDDSEEEEEIEVDEKSVEPVSTGKSKRAPRIILDEDDEMALPIEPESMETVAPVTISAPPVLPVAPHVDVDAIYLSELGAIQSGLSQRFNGTTRVRPTGKTYQSQWVEVVILLAHDEKLAPGMVLWAKKSQLQ